MDSIAFLELIVNEGGKYSPTNNIPTSTTKKKKKTNLGEMHSLQLARVYSLWEVRKGFPKKKIMIVKLGLFTAQGRRDHSMQKEQDIQR